METKTVPTLNYQPLGAMNGAWRHVLKTAMGGYCWLVTVLVVIAGLAGSYFARDVQVALFGIGIYIAYLARLVSRYKNQIWQCFATANGWQLDTTSEPQNLVPPSLSYGHGQHFSPIITAVLGTVISDIFTYTTTTGSGKYQQTHTFTVACLELPKTLPHIYLSSKHSNVNDERPTFDDHETLKLEGNFQDYFNLQIDKGNEVDALAVLTPDVMQTLIRYSISEDIEIWNQGLFFIMHGDARNEAVMRQMITSIVELSDQINENIRLSTASVS